MSLTQPGQIAPSPVGSDAPRVFKVALSGGPCGGKTTCISVLSDRFQALGYRVFAVPEAASIMLGGGMSFYNLDDDQAYTFQLNLLKVMLSLEDAFMAIAANCGQKAIVLCDRGAMDCAAYMSEPMWDAMLEELNLTTVALRGRRYDCVVHLVTAANGAEDFYTTQDHNVRTESAEKARELDRAVMDAWTGHPYFTVIGNRTDFKTKISRVMEAACKFLGETQSSGKLVKRKFLVTEVPEEFPVKNQVYQVEHDYLRSYDETECRVRKRGQYGSYVYTHTTRYPQLHGQKLQIRRQLTGREYVALRQQQGDPTRVTVVKERRSFIYENQCFELDKFKSCQSGLILLEAYLPADAAELDLPDFMSIKCEVTNNPQYSMYHIAAKQEPQSLGARIRHKYTHSGVGKTNLAARELH